MHWIIQDNLYLENGYGKLLNFLDIMEIPYTLVKFIPFSKGLPMEERMVPFVNPEGLVMVSGSVSLSEAATSMGWTPGSFYNNNHDYVVWSKKYGSNILNHDSVVSRLEDANPDMNEFFIRPCDDMKSFTGNVMSKNDFLEWKHKVLVLKETYTSLDGDTLVMWSQPKHIYRECRFFIVDGIIATYSTYKYGSRVLHVQDVPEDTIPFVNKMIGVWQPARAFCMDVGLTEDGIKIIEIGGINACGFYDADIQKYVMAIENMKF